MKNLRGLQLLLFVMLLSVAFVSCKDDKDDPAVEENKSEIVASWIVKSVTPEDSTETIPAITLLPTLAPCYNQLVLNFTSASKITTFGCDQLIGLMNQAGYLTLGSETTWKTAGDQLTITNGANTQSFKYSISGTDLKIVVDTDLAPATTKNIVLLLKKQ